MNLKNNGFLIVDKPKGMTSREVVNEVSKILKIKKIGHNGTLDPLATGVLVLCLGRATKLNNVITSLDKEYIAEVKLGTETDTLDIDGKIISKKDVNLTKEGLIKVINAFKKTYIQEVPLYSAVKVNGKKLYEYARKNETVCLPKKKVTISSIDLLSFNKDVFTFKCNVSKGTYVRSLIRDIMSELNEVGTMSNLRRTKQGKFEIKDAFSLEDIKNDNFKIIPISLALDVKKEIVSDDFKFKIINGQRIFSKENELVLYMDKDNVPLALYEPCGDFMKVKVMLYEKD